MKSLKILSEWKEVVTIHTMTDLELYFQYRCIKGLEERGLIGKKEYEERLKYEINTIIKMGYAGYFLIVWDMFRFAISKGIPVGPGRGSAGGSLVAYVLQITHLDPVKYGLIFERFLNPDRVSMPDIDMDFCEKRRGEVIQYVIDKYGHDKVAHIGIYGSMKAKASIRDVARTLGSDYILGDKLAKMTLEPIEGKPQPLKTCYEKVPALRNIRFGEDSEEQLILKWAERVENRLRTFGTHASGIVISDKPIAEIIPLYPGKDGTPTTQFEMYTVEEVGLIKFDFLGLRALTTIKRCVDMIKERHNVTIDPLQIPVDDPKTYKMLQEGNVDGIFQLEGSSGIRDLLVQIRPTNLEDIATLVAIYRPGPLQSDELPRYLQVRTGETTANIPHPALQDILGPTDGLLIYQEQILEICKKLAGYTMGQADLMRRAVGKKKQELMDIERPKFLKGMKENGFDDDLAKKLWDDIEVFSGYGFNKTVDKDTLVDTTKGPKKIKDFRGGEEVFSIDVNGYPVVNQVKCLHDHGKVPMWEVEFDNGTIEKCTLDHKWLTKDGQQPLWRILQENLGILVERTPKEWNLDVELCAQQTNSLREENETTGGLHQSQQGLGNRGGWTLAFLTGEWTKETLDDSTTKQDVRTRNHSSRMDTSKTKYGELQSLWSTYKDLIKSDYKPITQQITRNLQNRKVVRIKYLGLRQGYDLEVYHPSHNFRLASGLCCSNSHAVCYGYISYQMAYLKAHYPVEFMCSCLISDSDETDKVIKYLNSCKEMGIDILPPSINDSDYEFKIGSDGKSIRFGLSVIKNLGKPTQSVVEERKTNGPFKDILDFINRVDLSKVNRKKLESLVLSGAFSEAGKHTRASLLGAIESVYKYKEMKKRYDSKIETYEKKIAIYEEREEAIKAWNALSQEEQRKARQNGQKKPNKLKIPIKPEKPELPVIPELPELSATELLRYEKELTGYFISGHPLDYINDWSRNSVASIKDSANNKQWVELIAIPSRIKEITTKKSKKKMAYIALEDKTGTIEAVVLPKPYSLYKSLIDITTPAKYQAIVEIMEGIDGTKIAKLIIKEVTKVRKSINYKPLKITITVPASIAHLAAEKIMKQQGNKFKVNMFVRSENGNVWEMGTFSCNGDSEALKKSLQELS